MPLGLKYIYLLLFDPVPWEPQVKQSDVESDASAAQKELLSH